MPNLNAALLCGQIECLEDFIGKKRNLADLYFQFFSKFNNFSTIQIHFFAYVVSDLIDVPAF